MNIVLATPPSSGRRGAFRAIPSLGLAYVVGGIRHLNDINIKILDCTAEGLDIDESVEKILDLEPDVFGLSVHSGSIQRTQRLIKAVKTQKPDTLTITGGYHATAFDDLLLRDIPHLDMAMRGEVDSSFGILCGRLLKSEPIDGVPGLSYRSNGSIIRGEPQIIKDLNTVPFPDRSLLKSSSYWSGGLGIKIPQILRAATIVSSRGCPHRCAFCAKLNPQFDKYRARTAENVFQELRYLHESGYRFVAFVDENFSRNVHRLKELCRMILDSEIRMRFFFQGTVHNLDDSTLRLMHRAGFDGVAVGIESGSDRQLRRYKKASNSQGLADGVRRAKNAHMFVYATFICGAPEETEEDHQKTCRFVEKFRPHFCSIGELNVFVQSSIGKDLIGSSPAKTLENSRARDVHTIPGQHDKSVIEKRIRDFRRAFSRSWRNPIRILEFFDLLRHNPTIRLFLIKLLRNPRFVPQIFRGAPKR